MGSLDQRTDLLRVLLADDDDLHAFTLQCAINRISTACAFVRVYDRDALPRKIRAFEPEVLVVSGGFAMPSEVRQIKPLINNSPIICLVKTAEEAEASLSAGATDCLLSSQEQSLGECVEKHLNGKFTEPCFRAAAQPSTKGRLSSAEAKLEQLDHRIAVWLKNLAKTTQLHGSRLKAATKLGYDASRSWLDKQFRALRVKYLLRKQERLVHQEGALESRVAEAKLSERMVAQEAPDRIEQFDAPPGPKAPEDAANSGSLRAMELSFKALFHTALDATFLLDGHGSVLHLNPAACSLLGGKPADILGTNLFDRFPSGDKVRASTFWEAVLIEGQQKADFVLETTSGDQREVLISARANLWFGVHLLVARDQTELINLQREITTLRTMSLRPDLDHQTSTGPFGTGMAARCAEAGSMNDENSGAGR